MIRTRIQKVEELILSERSAQNDDLSRVELSNDGISERLSKERFKENPVGLGQSRAVSRRKEGPEESNTKT